MNLRAVSIVCDEACLSLLDSPWTYVVHTDPVSGLSPSQHSHCLLVVSLREDLLSTHGPTLRISHLLPLYWMDVGISR